ncbi:hypothetical protein DFH94DRAFT_124072 [Russula ochroleuca]|uniref:Secreted protein n=1 Tax=Russula ochroleuca TaxID=152965 RepID=A0A9P5MQ22_9AGAM|nr:hypothetical protein DFH94DRAFT_124072 [Russula ochroleuca]
MSNGPKEAAPGICIASWYIFAWSSMLLTGGDCGPTVGNHLGIWLRGVCEFTAVHVLASGTSWMHVFPPHPRMTQSHGRPTRGNHDA